MGLWLIDAQDTLSEKHKYQRRTGKNEEGDDEGREELLEGCAWLRCCVVHDKQQARCQLEATLSPSEDASARRGCQESLPRGGYVCAFLCFVVLF